MNEVTELVVSLFSNVDFLFLQCCCILAGKWLEEVWGISMLSRSHALAQNFNQEKAPHSRRRRRRCLASVRSCALSSKLPGFQSLLLLRRRRRLYIAPSQSRTTKSQN